MKRTKKWLTAVLLAAVLTGCGAPAFEELYCLPKATDAYYDLRNALEQVMDEGYTYLAPNTGANRETVQLCDLNGDGENEAVAFLKSKEGVPEIAVFARSDDSYGLSARIHGDGTAIASVEYEDLDGDSVQEMLVVYQVSDKVPQALNAYRYTGEDCVQMFQATCSRYVLDDLTGDGLPEVFTLANGGTDAPASAKVFSCIDGDVLERPELKLDFAYDSICDVQVGTLADYIPAIYISGVNQETQTLCAKAYMIREDGIRPVTPENAPWEKSPYASGTGTGYVLPADLNEDGILELAVPQQLTAPEGGSGEWIVNWYSLRSDGSSKKVFSTYETSGASWFFEIPEAWWDNVTLQRTVVSDTVTTVTFYSGHGETMLTLYGLRGDNRDAYAGEMELSTLYSDKDVTYASKLEQAAALITPQQVAELFHVRQNDWRGIS